MSTLSVTDEHPIVWLPSEITLQQIEVEALLAALDLGLAATAPGTSSWREQRSAQTMLIAKLWPELGELLGDPDDGRG